MALAQTSQFTRPGMQMMKTLDVDGDGMVDYMVCFRHFHSRGVEGMSSISQSSGYTQMLCLPEVNPCTGICRSLDVSIPDVPWTASWLNDCMAKSCPSCI